MFNAIGAVVVIQLIEENILAPSLVTYQFTYFSMYYIFFALLPMSYPDGNESDGKVILDLIRKKGPAGERVYRVHWNEEKKQWCVLDHDGQLVQAFDDDEQALAKAHEVADINHPSRLLNSKSGKETEVRNYPKIPL